MHIIHIASELAPLAKVGGLADVILGLSRELSWKGHAVDIIIPKYDCMDNEQVSDLTLVTKDLQSFYQDQWFSNSVWKGKVENLNVYFIESHHPREFFNRGAFYGCEDDIERFLYFSRAAIEFIYKHSLNPDIIHVHDWEAAIIPVLLKEVYAKIGLTKPRTVLTIHNMEYQGLCAPYNLSYIGLDGNYFLQSSQMQDKKYQDLINLLKGGIEYADFVTTVSPTYAKEVLLEEGGRGLESTLLDNQFKFKGILNGIDYSYWNPEIDRFLPAHFSSKEPNKKELIKKRLREKLHLEEIHRPIIGCITRLVPQKGIEQIKYAMNQAEEKKYQFVLLGSSPIPEIAKEFEELAKKNADNPHVKLILKHNEEVAHLIYAGCDLFIVPSIFEPCGLTQLIALRYGTVSIVRKTGGLADTIFDIENSKKPVKERNGFVFKAANDQELDLTLNRALDCWYQKPEKWRKLLVNGMNADFSWNKSSDDYLQIYASLSDRTLK